MENSDMPINLNHCEDDTDTTSSRKPPKKKQKGKASTVSARDGEETKTSKTNKWKQSLAQIKQMPEARTESNSKLVENDHPSTSKWKQSLAQIKKISEVRTDNNSPLVENTYLSTSKWKQSLIQIRRMAKTQTDNNSQLLDNDQSSTIKQLQNEMEDKNPKTTLNSIQMTLNEQEITRSLQIEEELSISNEEKQINLDDFDEKCDQDDELDIDTTMDLSSLSLTDNEIPEIMHRVLRQEKKNYTNLVLRDNTITSMGVKILVDELLTTPRCLKNIGLSSNPDIGDAGVKHLVRLLQGSRTVTFLALHNTGITDRGVRLLADALCDAETNSPSVLRKLYISFNKFITDESLEALIQILEHNQTLRVFSLQHCSLSDKARRRLRHICTKKKKRKFQFSD